MRDEKKIIGERKRLFSAHNMFLDAAKDALDTLSKTKINQLYPALTAITMSALAIEPLCNTIGDRIVPGCKDFERSSPIAKLRIICNEREIDYDDKKEPWSTVVWLSGIRNKLAHPKPELLKKSYEWSQEENTRNYFSYPGSRLEKDITKGNAERAYKRITELKFLLHDHMPRGKASGLATDMCVGKSSA